MKIVGYFVDIDGDKDYAGDVFVVTDQIIDHRGNIGIYCPIGQHSSASQSYIDKCETITREEYIKASEGYYTPKEYL